MILSNNNILRKYDFAFDLSCLEKCQLLNLENLNKFKKKWVVRVGDEVCNLSDSFRTHTYPSGGRSHGRIDGGRSVSVRCGLGCPFLEMHFFSVSVVIRYSCCAVRVDL